MRGVQMPRIVASEEGGIAAELTQLQQNQVLLVRKTRLCVPILCPEVIAPFVEVMKTKP